MNHRNLQHGVALLRCGQEQGSATVVAPTVAITTRHSVIDHLETSAAIELHLGGLDSPVVATLHAVTVPVDEDIVLLALPEPVDESYVTKLSAAHLPVHDEWEAFGFPSSRASGSWINGEVAAWLPQGGQPQDVELSLNDFQALRSYRGYSGGPVWVGGQVVAFLQRQLDGGLAATSVLRLRRYLDLAGISYRSAEGGRSTPPALRHVVDEARHNRETYWALETVLRGSNPGYALLVGSPGAGKTVVAAAFLPSDPRIHVVGTYFAGGDGDPGRLPPEFHRDPAGFARWLAQETALITGEGAPSRAADGARAHALSVERNLAALGSHFDGKHALGVLIIDDFCGLVGGTVDRSLGSLLPASPPRGLAIVLTAASQEFVRTAAPHLALAHPVTVTPLQPYDRERIVAAKLGDAIHTTDILRIAAASDGNPLILSYLIREAQQALADGRALPPTDGGVPTAQAFYEQQWARLSGSDASVWLVAFAARLRGRLPESELSSLVPDSVQVGLPTAWRTVGHLLRRERDGVEVFHSSFRDFVITQTAALDAIAHDRLANHCASETSDYCVANVIHHHLLGSQSRQQCAAARLTQEWLDLAATRFIPPAYILSDVERLLQRALAEGALVETIRLLLARSRVQFRYGAIFGKYAFELACVVSSLRGARKALRLVVHDGQLLCSTSEALAFIRRLVIAEEYETAVDVYEALRRVCFSQYQTGEITFIPDHLEGLGLLLRDLGIGRAGDMRMLYRVLGEAVREDGRDASLFKTRAEVLPAAATLWRWGWFVHSTHYRETNRPRYCAELAWTVARAHSVASIHGAPSVDSGRPPPTDVFRIFSAQEASAELEECCRGCTIPEEAAREAIEILMRDGRDPQVVHELARALPTAPTVQLRDANGVDANIGALAGLFSWHAIAEYTSDEALLERAKTSVREPWEQRFLDAAAWLGTNHGRLCRQRRESSALSADVTAVLQVMAFTLRERSRWRDAYALPEGTAPFLFARLSQMLVEFAPELAPSVSKWVLDHLEQQLGLYTEGCRASLWELAEGLSFCDPSSSRVVWRAFLSHVLACTSLLACAQGAADVGDTDLAEEALAHAIKASMGPSWYKEDQLTLLVDALVAAGNTTLSGSRWRELVRLLEYASGDHTFQRFIRYQKEGLVRHLATSGCLAEAVALATNYIWPDERTQFGRIESWRADKVTPIDGGRWGVLEIDPRAAALALLAGTEEASPHSRWAVIEAFLPGDIRHFASFARLIPALFDSVAGEQVRQRLLRVLVADFVPENRAYFVKELRDLQNERVVEWLREVGARHEWARSAPDTISVQSSLATSALNATPSPAEPSPLDPVDSEEGDLLYAPGIFGRPEGHRALDDAVRDAEEWTRLGDVSGARERYIEGLAAAQSAGWGIWAGNSGARPAIRGAFLLSDDPSAAVRLVRDIVLREEHALSWQIAGALIDAALPGRGETLASEIIEEVFAHVRAMLAPELANEVEYEVLSLEKVDPPMGASRALMSFLLSALDDACCHFRERVAATVQWLLASEPNPDVELLVERARVAVGRHSRELCLGIMHSWFVASPEVAKPALLGQPSFSALHADASFAARYVAFVVSGTALAAAGCGSTPPPFPSSWRWKSDCLKILTLAGDPNVLADAADALGEVCGAFPASRVVGLWRLRRTAVASKDFWSSPQEREAALRTVGSVDVMHSTEFADQLMWNPQWPDGNLDLGRSGICEQIFNRVLDDDIDDCFLVDGRVLLHAREVTFDVGDQHASQLEIVAFMVPSAYFSGHFDKELLFERWSTHGTRLSRPQSLAMPVEPAVVKFDDRRGVVGGSMTPARPSSRLLQACRTPTTAFERASWRDGREWEPFGVGRPLRDGTILTVDRGISLAFAGVDLVWCLLRDGARVALVDPTRRQVFRAEEI